MKEREIIKKFIEDSKMREEMRGQFFSEIPIGKIFVNHKSFLDDNNTALKKIDLLFIHERDLPPKELYPYLVYKNIPDLLKKIRIPSEERRFKYNSKKFKDFMNTLKGKQIKLFETKQKINWESLGQILALEKIFNKEYPFITIEEKGIVYEVPDKILLEVCKMFNISCYKI